MLLSSDCTDTTGCMICSQGTAGTCEVCKTRFYLSGTTCTACSNNCATCTLGPGGGAMCLTCDFGFTVGADDACHRNSGL